MVGNNVDIWFGNVCKRNDPSLRLFCFPYAGGSTAVYAGWGKHFDERIELRPVQYPGRGHRIAELPRNDVESLAHDLANAIEAYSDKPYAFFGHSMGALVAFEVARELKSRGRSEPVCLFLSGKSSPTEDRSRPQKHHLPDDDFLEALRDLDGTPEEFFKHPELMELLLPVLRADFQVVETYRYSEGPTLECDMHIFGGKEDREAPQETLRSWKDQSLGQFTCNVFSGGHFFFREQVDRIADIVCTLV